ncbi:MAG: DMT family transporter [Pseudorhodobacter sp.]
MRPMRGIAFKLLSVTLFIVMSALVKYVSDEVPPGQTVFFRSFFAIPVILVWLILRRDLPKGLRVTSVTGHIRRGVAGTAAMGLGFAGLAFLPLPEVTALGYAAPLLTVVFAALFLGERVRAFRISTVFLGLAGVLVVLSPRLGFGTEVTDSRAAFGAALVLAGAVCAALAQIATRTLVRTESTAAIVFCFSLTASVLALATLPFGWVMPDPATTAILVLIGVIGGFGQIFLTTSYREADASLVAPFDYASILFALAIGYWIFDEIPTVTMLAGAALVILAGILIIWREHRLGLERARQRKAMSPQG